MSFRQAYKLATKQTIRWFPGHMNKGIKQMQQKLRSVDCIIEVHDARIPFSGRNPEFHQTLIGDTKPHILVLNKKDLTEIREQRRMLKDIREREGIPNVVFTNCKDHQCPGIKRIVPLAYELISKSDRFHRSGERDCCVMIVGVPNVGKSSLLNVLRNRNLRRRSVSPTGAVAGVTRSVMEKVKISDDPLLYMIDTPGILEPRITDDEMGMKLALIGCMPDHLVSEQLIADYLLYQLNKQGRFEYVPVMGLQQPSDNIGEVLISYANKLGLQRKMRKLDGLSMSMPDIGLAAKHFIKMFRSRVLGGINLDREITKIPGC